MRGPAHLASCLVDFFFPPFVFWWFARVAYFVAQKPVTRHLIVAARPPKPARPDSATFINPPREAYPEAALTHRFRPSGDPGDPPPENHRDIELMEVSTKEKEKRKRKEGESGSPKNLKAKKAKTAI